MEDNFKYDDFVSQGDLGAIIDNLQTSKDDLELCIASLEEDVKKISGKITEIKALQDNLSRNISGLLNTAKDEVNRKDCIIAELQAQLDTIFRRNTLQSDSGCKRKRKEFNEEENSKKAKTEHVLEIPIRKESENCGDHDIDSETNKSSHKEDKTMIEKVNPESYSSRYASNHSGKPSHSKENTCRGERSTHREDTHNIMIEKVNQDPHSHNSSKYEYERNGKTSSLRENNSRQDRRDNLRDKRDNYKDSYKNNRSSRRDNWERYRESREHNRGYKDNNMGRRNRSKGYRSNKRDSKEINLDYRDNHRSKKETRLEDPKRTDEYRNEQNERFSTAEPMKSPSENFSDKVDVDILDYSREEGELSDEEMRDVPEIIKKEPDATTRDSGKNLPFDEKKSFNVYKFIEKQKQMGKKEDHLVSINEKNSIYVNNQENKVEIPNIGDLDKPHEKPDGKDVNSEIQGISDEAVKVQNIDCVEENKRLENVSDDRINSNLNPMKKNETNAENRKLTTEENLEENKESKEGESRISTTEDFSSKNKKTVQENIKILSKVYEESKDEKRTLLTVKNSKNNDKSNEDVKFDTAKNNVNIISQVILHEGMEDSLAGFSKSCPEDRNKSQEKKVKPPIIVPKLGKGIRESRVPRNLTDELNINLERSEKRQKLMTQLFGSSEKKLPKSFDHFSPTRTLSLNHEGEIPDLTFSSSPDIRERTSNHQASSITNSANPVTEFQIFKTNLPSLEKTNTLPNLDVKIQTPDNSATSKEKENLVEKSIPSSSDNVQESSKQKEIMKELSVKQQPVSTQAVNQNILQPSSDICSVSLDLDLDIRQCKAEDFPNLVAHSDLKDISDLLLTPVDNKKNDAKTQNIKGPNVKNPNESHLQKPELSNANQITKSADSNELCRRYLIDSDKKDSNHTRKSVPVENISNVVKKSSNVGNKDKMQNVANKNKTSKTVSKRNSSKLPKKSISKNIMNKKEIETDSNKDNQLITGEQPDTPHELKNEDVSNVNIITDTKNFQSTVIKNAPKKPVNTSRHAIVPQEVKSENEANVNKETTSSKDIHNIVIKSAQKKSVNTKSRRQNKSNVNKGIIESVVEPSDKPVSTSTQKGNVSAEPETASVNSTEAISMNTSDRRKRCGIKWF